MKYVLLLMILVCPCTSGALWAFRMPHSGVHAVVTSVYFALRPRVVGRFFSSPSAVSFDDKLKQFAEVPWERWKDQNIDPVAFVKDIG